MAVPPQGIHAGMAVVGGNLCRSAVYVLLMAQRVPPEQWLKPSRFSRPLARSIFALPRSMPSSSATRKETSTLSCGYRVAGPGPMDRLR